MRLREAAAYHEAGHFLARTVLMPDVWCLKVTIVPGGSVLGDGDAPGEYPLGLGPACDRAEALAIELFAGGAAELRYGHDPETVELSSRADVRLARQLLHLLEREPSRLGALELRLRARADELVQRYWREVELIARALLKHETLDGEEAERILASCGRDRAEDHLTILRQLPKHDHKRRYSFRAWTSKNLVDLIAARGRLRRCALGGK